MYIKIFTINSLMLDFLVLVYVLIVRIKIKMRKTDIFWSFIETENILFI